MSRPLFQKMVNRTDLLKISHLIAPLPTQTAANQQRSPFMQQKVPKATLFQALAPLLLDVVGPEAIKRDVLNGGWDECLTDGLLLHQTMGCTVRKLSDTMYPVPKLTEYTGPWQKLGEVMRELHSPIPSVPDTRDAMIGYLHTSAGLEAAALFLSKRR